MDENMTCTCPMTLRFTHPCKCKNGGQKCEKHGYPVHEYSQSCAEHRQQLLSYASNSMSCRDMLKDEFGE